MTGTTTSYSDNSLPARTKVKQVLRPRVSQDMSVVKLTARELANPSTIPASVRQQMPSVTDAQLASILKLDPFYASPDLVPGGRYTKVGETLQLDGPDAAGDTIPGDGIKIEQEASSGLVTGTKQTVTSGFGVDVSTSLNGFNFDSKIVDAMGWEYEESTELTTGTSQWSMVNLKTSTIGHHARYEVYFDHLFKTFAFVAPRAGSNAIAATGQIMRGKAPAAGEVVTFTLADGTRQRVVTNAKGEYRLYGAPAGAAKMRVGTMIRDVTLGSATPTALKVELDAVPVKPR